VRVIYYLTNSCRSAAIYNPEAQVAPACIIWTDKERQWEAIIPRLKIEMPELLSLGDYAPDKRNGPAIWLRCVIAEKVSDCVIPHDKTPVFYLPGVSRQDLRAVESCPDYLKPLAELQYRGVIWSQLNAKDWTILAFLKSDQGGLGLDVAQDNDTKNAMQLALSCLLDEEVDLLKGKHLDKDYFNTLVTGGDPARDVLQWLDQAEVFRASRGDNEWKAFIEVCKSQLAFNPQTEGVLVGATRLATHEGPWKAVWERFCEAPKRYPNIPTQIRKCKAPIFDLFSGPEAYGGWPQWNDTQEDELRRALVALSNMPSHSARKQIGELAHRHFGRRQLIWASLGEASLALALEHLAVLAEITTTALAAGSIEELTAGYRNVGWRADDAVVRALAYVEKQEDLAAIAGVIRSIYLPWAEESARYLQKVVDKVGYPSGTASTSKAATDTDGECILFVDGLRFDVAKRLIELLSTQGFEVQEKVSWAALPSVTATGKAAVTPVKDRITGKEANVDFEPCVADTGQSLKGGHYLKKLLADAGWDILERSSNGRGNGNAWCEFGDIDHEGHERGWKLAKYIDSMLREIQDRIYQLIEAGWKIIRIVTDHGWLLFPGGLPKTELPSALADNKWGRCAVIKPGAKTNERMYPWYWNQDQHFALADGISCFRKGEEYAHGGLSFQECLTLELSIHPRSSGIPGVSVEVTDIVWKGLRCTIVVEGQGAGLSVDIRTQPGDASSSVVVSAKAIKENGTASVVVENEELEGTDATVVIMNTKGELVAQIATVIGGGHK